MVLCRQDAYDPRINFRKSNLFSRLSPEQFVKKLEMAFGRLALADVAMRQCMN